MKHEFLISSEKFLMKNMTWNNEINCLLINSDMEG